MVLAVALRARAVDKLTLLDAAVSLEQLRVPPGNRREALYGDRAGQHSVRSNDRYRICFAGRKQERSTSRSSIITTRRQ
ncbi:MAG: type II toxin-antitoxin system RelE/ParE family toxin [Vulcanimicrobiaceae bacterium]